jgi:Ion channel
MLKRLKDYFAANVWKHVVLRTWSLAFLIVILLSGIAMLEFLSGQPPGLLRNWEAILLAAINLLGLCFVIIALLKRLLEIINGQRAASLKDLGYIGYSYVFVIAAFAAIYLAIDNYRGESFLHSNASHSHMKIFDHLYLSGITITTVGYGDMVPGTVPTKLLVVAEAVVGLWLTVTVLGVFIGSLLGRQLQDKQAKFFTEFQRDYFTSIGRCQFTINT